MSKQEKDFIDKLWSFIKGISIFLLGIFIGVYGLVWFLFSLLP